MNFSREKPFMVVAVHPHCIPVCMYAKHVVCHHIGHVIHFNYSNLIYTLTKPFFRYGPKLNDHVCHVSNPMAQSYIFLSRQKFILFFQTHEIYSLITKREFYSTLLFAFLFLKFYNSSDNLNYKMRGFLSHKNYQGDVEVLTWDYWFTDQYHYSLIFFFYFITFLSPSAM